MNIYTYDTAKDEAARCLMCNDAPCHGGCPASVDPKKFIRKIRFEDMEGAVKLLREKNVLAASCAYICPCLSTCGAKCTHEKLTSPIDISGLQRYVMDWERENGMIEPKVSERNGKKVAVIGSGPAGLSCASKLASLGYEVEIFEKENIVGGQLRLSIPGFRLPEEVLDFEIEFIKKLGVKINLNSDVENPKDLLSNGYDAIFVGAGLTSSRQLGIEGENKKGFYDALDFLSRTKRGEKIDLGKRVLVIGGGDTAIDAARISAKAGAQVLMLYRRTQKDMPAYRPDIDEAFEDGVEMWYRVVPLEVLGGEKIEGLKVARVNWKGEGRLAKEYEIEGPEFVINADTVINASGQIRSSDFGLNKNDKGWITVNDDSFENTKGIFVGGDLLSGGATAVAAVGEGREAAEEIHRSLTDEKEVYSTYFSKPKADLKIDFCGVEFENPFILAAAPPSDELDMVRNAFKAGWAGAVLKTTSVEGTPVDLKYPMMSGMNYEGQRLASMGNIDLISEYHIDEVEKRVKTLKSEFPEKRVIASIMGSKKEDWQSLVTRLSDAGVDVIECSFSCPQGSLGAKPGQMLAQDTALTKTVAGWVKDAAKAHPRNVPVVIKITPHVSDIAEVAQAVKDAGADAVCASNTIQSLMGIDVEDFIPYPKVNEKSTYSGMSGPAIKPITLKVISEIASKVGIKITGTGGPVNWRDALEFMMCGATTVQFCTAVMHYGYDIIDDLKDGMLSYMERKGVKSPSELIGKSLPFITSHEELPYSEKVVSKIDHNKCICDDLCYIACRDGGHMAINLDEERKPIVDEEKCVGCGLCKLICPVTDCIKIDKK